MNRKDAKNAKKTFIIVKTNTKAVARRAGVFIDYEFSYRINKNKTFAALACPAIAFGDGGRLERGKRPGG